MRTKKPFTSATFTIRVDHEAGRHRTQRANKEPAVCIKQLLRNEAERAAEDNPLARILEWEKGEQHQLTVSTTTEHLAQRLGHTLEKAFGGSVDYDFSHENKLARVSWRREH